MKSMPTTSTATRRIGCVSYLNAKPLIEGIDDAASDVAVRFDVPSGLLADLENGDVDIALCPVIDYYRSRVPLKVVPVGGIGSAAETLTVRLYSRVPIADITDLYADIDSHTSVVLVRVLLRKLHNVQPRMIDFAARGHTGATPDAMLLIGDKVVTASPSDDDYPHQLDLGQAWRDLTGLPFLFAVWMARDDADLGDLPAQLDALRIANRSRIDAIADRCAPRHNWPADLARRYLGKIMQYEVGKPQLDAMRQFAKAAHELGLIDHPRPLRLHT